VCLLFTQMPSSAQSQTLGSHWDVVANIAVAVEGSHARDH
jgi:hypothetical protein